MIPLSPISNDPRADMWHAFRDPAAGHGLPEVKKRRKTRRAKKRCHKKREMSGRRKTNKDLDCLREAAAERDQMLAAMTQAMAF